MKFKKRIKKNKKAPRFNFGGDCYWLNELRKIETELWIFNTVKELQEQISQ